ncbi:MAG: Mth938-like domain-containing protein [Magnetovibrio sp.]|nr:Mth938-like domain-containing protein [Magnetovibrio sp.]
MSLDITPQVPLSRQIIKAYGDGGFVITGQNYTGSVLVFLEQTLAWSGDITLDALKPVIDHPSKPDILVIGCGPTFSLPCEELRAGLRAHGIVLEWMDTAAACRTYNVLAIEERAVAAALVAVD